ncbi:MAG: RIP metalloprotease RseP [Planctomycetes bacterium]|nr:RIP metalloprotease RseP [Planctomycetota bacterium]
MPDVPNVIYAVLGFGFIIFIHELGHFVAAKLFGIKVEAFSLGYPPTILHRKFRETDYRLGIIPMGGYVSMLGEDPRESVEDPRALCNARPWKRAVVFLAGVALNVATAMVIYMVASFIGIEVTEPLVGGVSDGSPAQAAGLEVGDRIVEIDGKKIEAFEDMRAHIAVSALDDIDHEFQINYQREGAMVHTVTLKAEPASNGMPLPGIGIAPPILPRLSAVKDDSPAALVGLKTGDRVAAVNGQPIRFYNQVPDLIENWPEQPLTITVARNGTTVDLAADPEKVKMPDYGLDPAIRIKKVEEDSPAARAGLKKEDDVVGINDLTLPTFTEVHKIIGHSKDKPVRLLVCREGRAEPVAVTVTPQWDDVLKRPRIGVTFGSFFEEAEDVPVVHRYSSPGPAAAIPEGSRIEKINDESVRTWLRLWERLDEAKGRDVTVTYVEPDGNQEKTVTIVPRTIVAESPMIGTRTEKLVERRLAPVYNPLAAFNIGFKKIANLLNMQYVTIKALANRTVPAKEISGPLRIGVFFYESSKMGMAKFMTLLGLVSVAIALMNAMPIPPLDGGHVLFLVIEKIMRRPVPIKVRGAVTMAGTVLLLCVVAMAFFNDGSYILRTYFY